MTDRQFLSRHAVQRLIQSTEPWLSCDDCFEQVDVAVDALLDSTAALSEPLRIHLLGCAACHDEAIALTRLVSSEHNLTPTEALALLDAAMQGVND